MNKKLKMSNKQNRLIIIKINKINIHNMIKDITTIIIMIKIKIIKKKPNHNNNIEENIEQENSDNYRL